MNIIKSAKISRFLLQSVRDFNEFHTPRLTPHIKLQISSSSNFRENTGSTLPLPPPLISKNPLPCSMKQTSLMNFTSSPDIRELTFKLVLQVVLEVARALQFFALRDHPLPNWTSYQNYCRSASSWWRLIVIEPGFVLTLWKDYKRYSGADLKRGVFYHTHFPKTTPLKSVSVST